jgi:hypothetical protein
MNLKSQVCHLPQSTAARARKRQLIDELTADNARMRRQALILLYLPDPVIVIGLDGEIKFCNMQAVRVLKHAMENLEGASILDVLVPESQPVMHRLIQDLATAERIAAAGVGTDQSFTVMEVKVNGNGENVSDSSDDLFRKKNVCDGGLFETSSNHKPPAKKCKTADVDDVMGASVTANNAGAKL